MQCQVCESQKATIHCLELVDGKWVQQHVCQKCALGGDPGVAGANLMQMFGNLLLKQAGMSADTSGALEGTSCPGCGMSYEQFQERRRLGCARCYEAFEADLERIFLRVQEETTHRGKVPGRPAAPSPAPLELRRLRENLRRAIEEERFEDAALFRDQIRRLEESNEGDER